MNPIAVAISASQPQPGQSERSGPDFQLFASNGSSMTVSCQAGISFDIMHDKFGSDPTVVSSAGNGTTIDSGVLEMGTDYYIANPNNASGNFVVVVNQG